MFVASVGFLTDAYDIFALNIVNLIVPYVYLGQRNLPKDWQAALLISTLAGTLIGQILFGFFGDKYGRRKMYGYELIVLIVGSIGTAMASSGEAGSMSILGWLTTWRIVMGIGIGADYPLVSHLQRCCPLLRSSRAPSLPRNSHPETIELECWPLSFRCSLSAKSSCFPSL